MSLVMIVRQTTAPGIQELEENRDIRGLISLISDPDYIVRKQAADSLGRIGTQAISILNNRAGHGEVTDRLWVVEAIARIKSRESIPVLQKILSDDPSNEMRWIAAIALGEVGEPMNIPILVAALEDRDKYVRYGAVKALEKLDWEPCNEEEKVKRFVAFQEWSAIPGIGEVPVGTLMKYFDDPDPKIRASVVTILGILGDPRAEQICERAMSDPNPDVRWKASLAFPQCRVPLLYLPRGLFHRIRTGKSIFGAMVLNFFFLGLGYFYLGKWWGILLFAINSSIVTLLGIMYGNVIPYMNMVPYGEVIPYGNVIIYFLSCVVTSPLVIHTWYLGKGILNI